LASAGNRGRLRLLLGFETSIILFWAGQHVYVPFLSVYARAQGASLSLVGVVVAGYGLVQALLRLPLGIASDRIRRRKPFVLLGYASVLISCLGLAWSPRPGWLLVFRAVAGVGASTWAMITALFASRRAGQDAQRAVTLAAFFQQAGLVGAYFVGALVGGAFGLEAPFVTGALLAGLGLLLIGREPEEVAPTAEPVRFAQLARVIFSPRLLVVSGVGALLMYINNTLNGFVPLLAQQVGASTAQLGWLVAGGQAAGAITAFVASRLAGDGSERTVVLAALLLVTAAIVAMACSTSLLWLAMARVAYGLSFGLLYPTLAGLSVKTVAREERASAMSVFTALYAIGMFVGPSISGVVAERVGLSGMFAVTSMVGVLAMMLTWVGIPGRD